MTYLLDSNVVFELTSQNPDPGVIRWLDSQPENNIYISVVTLAEIAELIDKEQSASSKTYLINWLTNDLLVRFSDRISEIGVAVSLKWGEIINRFCTIGSPISLTDSLNLAIALVNDHTLVTRDSTVFEGTGLKTICPFEKE
jgi:toxin FitB